MAQLLKINEVFYNQGSGLPQGGNQFIELYNADSNTVYLDGMLLTTEVGVFVPPGAGTEGLYKWPGVAGENNYPVAPGEFVVVAVDAIDATATADWEVVSLYIDNDNPSVPNLEQIFGERDLSLNPYHDNLIIADGTDTNVPIDTSTILDGMNYGFDHFELAWLASGEINDFTPDVAAEEGLSLNRCSDGSDSDFSSGADFIPFPTTFGSANDINCLGFPGLSISDAALLEGSLSNGYNAVNFTVSLNQPATQEVSVSYQTVPLTTDDNFTDYADLLNTNIFVFAPGELSKTGTLNVAMDFIVESDEIVYIVLSAVTNALILDPNNNITILDDDGSNQFWTITSVSKQEGDAGTTSFDFVVQLSAAGALPLSIDYLVSNGTAEAGSDYTDPGGGTLNFAALQVTQTVSIAVNGDSEIEDDEAFSVVIFNSSDTNVPIAVSNGVGTIINDDFPPQLLVSNAYVFEGNAGTVDLVFTAELSFAFGSEVSVLYWTEDISATSGIDYTAVPTSSVVFAPGDTQELITITISGDTDPEPDETFALNFSDPTNLLLITSNATGVILDDDAPREIRVTDVTASEGNAGSQNFSFLVWLSAGSFQEISVNYQTADGTAVGGDDYTAVSETLLVFAPGSTGQTVNISVSGDTLYELDDTFTVTLSDPTNGIIVITNGTGTIQNDDAQPSLSISDASLGLEGNAGTSDKNHVVTLSAVSGVDTFFNYQTVDGSAVGGDDYVTIPTTLMMIPAGTASTTLTVAVNGDLVHEGNESYSITISDPTNAPLNDASGTTTILNDDPLPIVTITNASGNEGNNGTTLLQVQFELSNPSASSGVFNVRTTPQTALTPWDFAAISAGTQILVPAGVTTGSINIEVVGDQVYEFDETLFLSLSAPTGLALAATQNVVTILNDDAAPTITIDDQSIVEPDAGDIDFTFNLYLTAQSEAPVSVNWATSDGTATDGEDYTGSNLTLLVFTSMTTSRTITVTAHGDNIFEGDETFFIDLSDATNATIADPQGTATILNDDTPPFILNFDDRQQQELNEGTNGMIFEIPISTVVGVPVSVNVATFEGTATEGVDYVGLTNFLVVVPAGSNKVTFAVPIIGDSETESDETFSVTISAATNAVVLDSVAFGTILDDELYFTDIDFDNVSQRVSVTWTSSVGVAYTVQYTTNNTMNNTWSTLIGGSVVATGTTTRLQDIVSPGVDERTYRVRED